MIELVEAVVEPGGVVREKWTADAPIAFDPVDGWKTREWHDDLLDLYYAEVVRPYRGPVEVPYEGPKKFRRFLAYATQGEKVSKCMREGAAMYASATGRWPEYAFVKELPKGAEEFIEVDGVMLVQAEWALPGYVFIGG